MIRTNLDRAIRAENAVIEGFPGVTFGLHICRGNPRGIDASGKVRAQWHRDGHYDSIAEKLFQLKHQRLLLEYDSERAGSFDVLRFVREGTAAVLGVLTTKSEQIEQVVAMKRRVEMAAKYLVEQLAVSPRGSLRRTAIRYPFSEKTDARLCPGTFSFRWWWRHDRAANAANAI
ncbi:MAG: hypothetical protein WBD90_13035 [Xanthobacteraceae bacterium]